MAKGGTEPTDDLIFHMKNGMTIINHDVIKNKVKKSHKQQRE
jgi:hypothetical protein